MLLYFISKIDVRIDYKHFVCTITIIRDDLFNFVHYVQTIVQLTIKHTKDRSSYLGLGIGVHINCYPSTHLIFYVGYFLAKLLSWQIQSLLSIKYLTTGALIFVSFPK